MNSFKYFLFLVILPLIYLSLYIGASFAQTMSNDDYTVQMGNLNSISGRASGSGKNLTFTSGETGAHLFTGTNYKVRAGFQYINSIIPFTFSISSIFIDFGIINPTTPVTRTNDLTVSFGSAHGYQVTASQNHNLRADATGFDIPPTTCDSGTCTTTTAAAWTSSLVYGFGYRCDNITGTDCDSGFATADFYKQFISSPSAVSVMSSLNVGRNRKGRITYKVNVAGTQPSGLYTNIINYIATATF
ncbi:MAG: hypothetical protein HY344_03905 [Candidatus Levybacteria bacterium]|nr:hypothetical protein [Candidatus Levybacteria bacterium]